MLKVHLSAHPEVYGRASAELTGDKVNKNLLLDSRGQHLYITREKRVSLRRLRRVLSIRAQTKADQSAFITPSEPRSKQIKAISSLLYSAQIKADQGSFITPS